MADSTASPVSARRTFSARATATPLRRSAAAGALLALVASAMAGAGCIHLVEPPEAPTIALDSSGSDPLYHTLLGARARALGAYESPSVLRLRDEGVHRIDVDLREWTARLLRELERELGRRGVFLHVPDASLDRTASARPLLPPRQAPPDEALLPTLTVSVDAIRDPQRLPRRVPVLEAHVDLAPGGQRLALASQPWTRTIPGAFFDLKKQLLADSVFLEWLRTYGLPLGLVPDDPPRSAK